MKAPTISLLAAALLASTLAAAATKTEPQKPADTQPAQGQAKAVNGFEPTAGEAGWQLAQHRYVIKAGRLEHSAECDHTMRPAPAAPTSDELEMLRRMYPDG